MKTVKQRALEAFNNPRTKLTLDHDSLIESRIALLEDLYADYITPPPVSHQKPPYHVTSLTLLQRLKRRWTNFKNYLLNSTR